MNSNQMHRTFTLDRSADDTSRTADLAFSSEIPYERWFGIEILDHNSASVDLSRLADGRHPLLLNHNTEDQIGVVEKASVGTDRIGRAVVRFGRGVLADEIFKDVQDGIRTLVSVGYMINQIEANEKSEDGENVKRTYTWPEFQARMKNEHGDDCFERQHDAVRAKDNGQMFRVTDWTPFEISIVSIPADATVGVGRSLDSPAIKQTPKQEKQIMSDTIVITADPASEEKARVNQIRAIAVGYAKYGATEMALEYIGTDKTVQDFQNAIMAKMATAHTADTGAANIGMSKPEQKRYSVLRAIRAMHDRNWTDAGFEQECHKAILKRAGMDEAPNNGIFIPYEVQARQLQTRDLIAATGSLGGFTVATDNLGGSFIDLLRNRSMVAKMGATMLSGLQGNVTIPRQTAANTATWLTNEATAITETNLTLGQLSLTPKNIGAYQELSRQLLLQSSPAADALVMNDLAQVLAIGIDLAALTGSGAAGQPLGVTGTAGIGSVAGGALTYALILEYQTDVAGSNALATNCGYLTTPTVAAIAKQKFRQAGTDTPLWVGNILDGTVEGFKAASTLQMPAGNILFGDFSQIIIAEWGMLEITLNPYANFAAAITGIRAIQTVDIGVRVAGAFSLATGVTA